MLSAQFLISNNYFTCTSHYHTLVFIRFTVKFLTGDAHQFAYGQLKCQVSVRLQLTVAMLQSSAVILLNYSDNSF